MRKKLYTGKLYLLSNPLWNKLRKIGVAEDPASRIKPMQTALPDNISILFQSNLLLDKFFYEHLLSEILYKFRYRTDREFYEIDTNDFIQVVSTIEIMNKLYDSEEKLLEFIEHFDKEYYKSRFREKKTVNNIIKKGLYVCTE